MVSHIREGGGGGGEGRGPKLWRERLTSHVTVWIHRVFSRIVQKLCMIAVADCLQHSYCHALLQCICSFLTVCTNQVQLRHKAVSQQARCMLPVRTLATLMLMSGKTAQLHASDF